MTNAAAEPHTSTDCLVISTDQTGLRTARKKAKPRANETSDAILRLATAGQGLDAIVRRLVQQGLRENTDRLPIARQLRTTRFAEVRRKRDIVCSLILTCIGSAASKKQQRGSL